MLETTRPSGGRSSRVRPHLASTLSVIEKCAFALFMSQTGPQALTFSTAVSATRGSDAAETEDSVWKTEACNDLLNMGYHIVKSCI